MKFSLRWMFSGLVCLLVSFELWVGGNITASSNLLLLRGWQQQSQLDTTSGGWKEQEHNVRKTIDAVTRGKLQNAGLNLTHLDDETTLTSIPDWATIEKILGSSKPHIIGLETCEIFRSTIVNDPGSRFLGVSGFFNSGTNLLSFLLAENCDMKELGGNSQPLWQVPWGKHALASSRDARNVSYLAGVNKTRTLPVVMIRNPFRVLVSMCRNSYSVHYPNDVKSFCPHMVDHGTGRLVEVGVGQNQPVAKYPSIAHFWNRWYREYLLDFPHPRLMVRLEDLTVRPRETVAAICDCVGGKMSQEEFSFLVTSAKEGMGHGKTSETNGLIEGWLRLGRDAPFSLQDYEAATTHLDQDIMSAFLYKPPPRDPDNSTWFRNDSSNKSNDYHRYDRFYWEDLSENIQIAAEILGYNQSIWDKNGDPESFSKYWDDLSDREKAAAKEIGYNKDNWD